MRIRTWKPEVPKRATTDETDVGAGGFYSDRLARRIGFRIFSFALALVVASGVIAYLHVTERETDRIRDSVSLFVSGTEAALGTAIWNYDSQIIERTAQTALLIPGVAGVLIEEFVLEDKAHTSLRLGRYPESIPTFSPSVVSRNLTQSDAGVPVGRISLVLDDAYIAWKVQGEVATTVSVVVLISFALSIAAFLMIYVDVTCPLHSIVGTVSRFAPDAAADRRNRTPSFDPRTTSRSDSIGIVATSLLVMMQRLDQSFGETQRQSERLARQRETTLRLSRSDAIRSGDLAAFARQIVDEVQALLDADRVGVWIADANRPNSLVAVSQYDRRVPELTAGDTLDLSAVPAYAQALSRGVELPIEDARAAEILAELHDSYLEPTGVGALLDVPVLIDGRLLGLVCIEMVERTRAWEDDECLFAWQLGALVALTYEAQRRHDSATALEAVNRTLELRIAARTEELARAEAIVRTAIDSMSAAVSIYTADRRLFEWNETYLDFYPEIRSQIEFEAPVERIYSAMVECGYVPLGRAGSDGLEVGTHLETTRFGRRLQTTISAIPDGGFVVVSVDLTEIQSARDEAELAASIMRETIETMNSSYAVWRADGTLAAFSDNFPAGMRREFPLRTGMAWREFRAAIERSGAFKETDASAQVKGGDWHDIDSIGARLGVSECQLVDGKFVRITVKRRTDDSYMVVALDLTEMHQARRSAELSAMIASRAIGSLKASYTAWSEDGRLMKWESTLPIDRGPNGLSQSAYVGMTWTEFAEAFKRQAKSNLANQTRNNGRVWTDDIPLVERIGVWDREKTDGTFLRSVVSRCEYDTIIIVTLDLTEIHQTRRRAEISEQVLREVVSAIGAAYTVWSADERLVDWGRSATAGTMFAAIRGNLAEGVPFRQFLAAGKRNGFDEVPSLSTTRGGQVYSDDAPLAERVGQWRRAFADGRCFDTRVAPLSSGGYVVASIDLTEITRAKRAAEASERILREAIEALGASYTVWSAEGLLEQHSHNVFSLYDEKIDRLGPGMPFADFTAMISRCGFREDPRFSTVRDGHVFSTLDEVAAAVGSWDRAMPGGRFLRTTGTALSNGNFALVTIDLTELDKTRRASAHAEATLREIVTQMKASFGTYSRDEKLMIYGDMYGHGKQEDRSAMADAIAGTSYESILQRRIASGFEEIREKSTIKNGKTYLEYTPLSERLGVWERFLTDGRYMRTTVSRLRDGSFAVFTQDLTELNEANEALAKSDRMASLGSLVAGVAHEVNTPIGIAMTASTMLVEELSEVGKLYGTKSLSPAKFQNFLERSAEIGDMIVRNVGRAGELIANFKQVSIDQTSDSRRRFDLKAYVADVVQSLTPAIARSTHKVEVHGPEGVQMNAFPGAIAQIVTNLVMNAMLHAFSGGRTGGRVTFGVAGDADNATLLYEDDGVGMDDATLKRVFDPFFTTKRGSGGTGLGMTIVFNLVTQRLGGQIELTSRQGAGVRMKITLPSTSPGGNADPTAI
jgi:signal transduction histidine kinase/PAS domain-containing protein